MKKLVFIILIVWIGNAKAQTDTYEYVPVPDNAVWSVNTLKFKTFGDTIINDKSYLKVYWQTSKSPFEFDITKASYFCALRNDTVNKRVYGVYKEAVEVKHVKKYAVDSYNSTDTTEFLLYDFSLKAGDTISAAVFFDYSSQVLPDADPYQIIIYEFVCISTADSIITLNDNTVRRKITMNILNVYVANEANEQYWIEGIGSTNGLFSPTAYSYFVTCYAPRRLLCFSVNEELLISFPEFDYDSIPDDCYCIGDISNINEYSLTENILIFPNPVQDVLTVEIRDIDYLLPYRLAILDVLGKEIKHFNINDNKTTLNISDLSKGFYFLHIQTHQGVSVKRFVKE